MINRFSYISVLLILLSILPVSGQEKPQVWGYGVKSCQDYTATLDSGGRLNPEMSVEYYQYQAWLEGLITGLSLATASDMLQGVGMESAMQRIGVYCDDHRSADFFQASMNLLKSLTLIDLEPED